MLINEHTAILTRRILLVPYSKHHVPSYHEWMQDEELQKATASEPLTLDEEYAMQRSWRQDADKLTFIACTASEDLYESQRTVVAGGENDAPEKMIGDVNLFIHEADDEQSDEESESTQRQKHIVGEVEIMIASKNLHGQGYGLEVLRAFLWYFTVHIREILLEYCQGQRLPEADVRWKYLRVKVDKDNIRSIRLFERAGFQKVSEEPNYFGEVELRKQPGQATIRVDGPIDPPLLLHYASLPN